MRLTLPFLALPALTLAAEQQPLLNQVRGWFSKASSLLPSKIPVPTAAFHIPNPLDAGAAKVAELVVHPLNRSNWHYVLDPAGPSLTGEPHEWLVYIYGNASCQGECLNATKAWNTSTAILSALPNPPSLASIDCDALGSGVLCSLWDVKPPSIYHLSFPASGALTPTIRYIPLNQSATSAASISSIHTASAYQLTEPYKGAWHPWTGWLATSGLAVPLAWFLFAMSKLPAWAPMVIVSLLSRTMMRPALERRMGGSRTTNGPVAPAPAAPVPAAPKT